MDMSTNERRIADDETPNYGRMTRHELFNYLATTLGHEKYRKWTNRFAEVGIQLRMREEKGVEAAQEWATELAEIEEEEYPLQFGQKKHEPFL